jgi:hypothetical protein
MQQRAVWTSVEHNYRVVRAAVDSAEVADTYVDNSQFVDPSTPQPPVAVPAGDAAERTVRELYVLEKLDGTWKVVDGFKAT